jgi:parallel beta-helix repeat protein
MLKAFAIVVILLLAYTSAVAYSQSSGWLITVQTDKPYYYVGDKVYISGRLTYNGYHVASVDVSIVVRLSGSTGLPYHLNTTTTDLDGMYYDSFPLAGALAILGEYIVNATAGVADTRCTNQTSFQLINTIYIRADGKVDPAEAPISRNGEVYSLTGNISGHSNDGIVVERNNIILDGAGFTVNGTYSPNLNGISLTSVDNVTVRNISVRFFSRGICENLCHSCHIVETNLSSDGYGIYFQQSHFNTIGGNIITKNSYAGIYLEGSDNNNINDNELKFNTILSNGIGGIRLVGFSNGNIIVDNTLVNNTHYGIYIDGSNQNSIFHDNFVNHTTQAFVDTFSQNNVWDDGYPSGGNYWSNYAGADVKSGPNQNLTGSDNIGDTAYTINSKNKDNYPLMNAWNPTETNITINGTQYSIKIITNATITQFDSTPNNLNFTMTGTGGTKGYLLIIVPKGLNSTDLKVYIKRNGIELTTPPPTISDNSTHYFIYCELSFSTLQITVFFVVPVTPLGTLAATISMISILGVYVKLRKRKL